MLKELKHQRESCAKHNIKLSKYCISCDEAFCSKCKYRHQNHEVKEIEDHYRKTQKMLSEQLDKVKDEMKVVKSALEELETAEEELQGTIKKIEQDVTKYVQSRIQCLDQQKEELEQQLKATEDATTLSIHEKKRELKARQKNLELIEADFKTSLIGLSHIEVVKRQQQLLKPLQEINKKPVERKVRVPTISFQNSEMDESSSFLGSIVVNNMPKSCHAKLVQTIVGVARPCGIGLCNNGTIVVSKKHDDQVTIFNEQWCEKMSIADKRYPCGVAGVCDDSFMVVNQTHLHKFDAKGKVVKEWKHTLNKESEYKDFLEDLHGITVDPKTGHIFLVDAIERKIFILKESEGSFALVKSISSKKFSWPTDAALDSEGDLYVVDKYSNCIYKCSLETNRITKQIGSRGEIEGKLASPSFIAVDRQNLIYVTEQKNNRISVFNTNGDFITCIGKNNDLKHPSGIAVDEQDRLFVCDTLNNRILVYQKL